jgi:hypothetical protein
LVVDLLLLLHLDLLGLLLLGLLLLLVVGDLLLLLGLLTLDHTLGSLEIVALDIHHHVSVLTVDHHWHVLAVWELHDLLRLPVRPALDQDLLLWHLAVDDHLVVLRDLAVRLEHHSVLALWLWAWGHAVTLALGLRGTALGWPSVLGGSAGHAAALLLRHPVLSLLLLLLLLLLHLLLLLLLGLLLLLLWE